MDYENNYNNQHPNSMATAAMVLGIISLVTSCCLYIAIPVGAIGIILALLSKGYEPRLSSRGKTGLGLSLGGFAVSIAMILFILFSNTIYDGKSFEKIMEDYQNYYNPDGETAPKGNSEQQTPQDIENWLKDYLNGNGERNIDPMPEVTPTPKKNTTPIPSDVV